MSLLPGFLDELKSRTSLAQVVGRKVSWDQRKSNQGKGDLWSPCPFHQEKTASFHVDDRKGFYYCFGCHAKGDIFSFVQETENVGFMEAIEILVREAGMQMPARDPKAQEKADRRSQLVEVMEQAVQFFRLQLKTGQGAAARDYLVGRGLSEPVLERWEIGFAPPGWQGLWYHLTGKGVAEELILAAGLAKPSNQGKRPYDTFRDRIIFPIRDARGRAIAFGGRAMNPSDNAKYLNSPETELFDKGRSLYNMGPAREASGNRPLIVAEGYMDVIALSEAGFKATVAPLGTAITEDQLQLLWRMHDEPIIALDGDDAGIRAALRLIDLAVPSLTFPKSLKFCIFPKGLDPDDFVRSRGTEALEKRILTATGVVDFLWARMSFGDRIPSIQEEAQLSSRITTFCETIKDQRTRRAIRDALNSLLRNNRWNWQRQRSRKSTNGSSQSAQASELAAANDSYVDAVREAVILATLVRHPDLIEEFEAELERLETTQPAHETVRRALIGAHPHNREEIEALCGAEALEKLFQPRHVRISPGVQETCDRDMAAMSVAEELAKLAARRGARSEIEDAARDIEGLADEGLTWRLRQVSEGLTNAGKSVREGKAEYDLGPNGARLNRDEKRDFEALIERIDYSKGNSGRRS